MIIESQTVKTKSELQTVIQKMRMSKAVIYQNVDKKGLQEILSSNQLSKKVTVLIIEL